MLDISETNAIVEEEDAPGSLSDHGGKFDWVRLCHVTDSCTEVVEACIF